MNAVLERRSKIAMQDHVSDLASQVSYGTSAMLILGKTLDFLNTNAAACGVILGFLTFLINWYYKRVSFKAIEDNGKRRRKTDFENTE